MITISNVQNGYMIEYDRDIDDYDNNITPPSKGI